MELLQWFFLIFSSSILLLLIKLTMMNEKKNLPPGPRRLPIIGNLHQLTSLQHRSLSDISKKHGPIMLMHWGTVPVVVVSSAELATEIFKEHDIAFSNRPYSPYQNRILRLWGGRPSIAFASYGEEWRQGRNTSLSGLLNPKKIGSFASAREHEVAAMVETLSQSCCSQVNLTNTFVSFSYNILSRCITGRDSKREDVQNFGELVLELVTQVLPAAFFVRDYFPWLAWVDNIRDAPRKLDRYSRDMDIYLEELINRHPNEQDNPDHTTNLVDHLLHLLKENKMSRGNVNTMILEMFLAIDRMSITMEVVMSELAKNPNQMKKAQEEVRRVIGTKSKIDQDDIKHMNHLNCIVKETLRLRPPLPLMARETSVATSLGGYHIPANTAVFINLWEIQRDIKLWDRPHEFIPERFNNTSVDYKGLHQELIPFGSGRRGCPGMMFAMAFVELVIANLLCWFEWELPEGNKMDKEEDLLRKNPLLLVPLPRNP